MKKIFLASKSPRRKQILTDAGIDFNIINSSYDEQLDSHDFSYSKIEALALNKALGAKEFATNDALIIGADTVVILDNVILTKPKDFDFRIWSTIIDIPIIPPSIIELGTKKHSNATAATAAPIVINTKLFILDFKKLISFFIQKSYYNQKIFAPFFWWR